MESTVKRARVSRRRRHLRTQITCSKARTIRQIGDSEAVEGIGDDLLGQSEKAKELALKVIADQSRWRKRKSLVLSLPQCPPERGCAEIADANEKTLEATSKGVEHQHEAGKRLRLQPTRTSEAGTLDMERLIEESLESKRAWPSRSKRALSRSSAEFFANQNREINNDAVSAAARVGWRLRLFDRIAKVVEAAQTERTRPAEVFGAKSIRGFGPIVQWGHQGRWRRCCALDAGAPLMPMAAKGAATPQTQATQAQSPSSAQLPEGVDEMSILRRYQTVYASERVEARRPR